MVRLGPACGEVLSRASEPVRLFRRPFLDVFQTAVRELIQTAPAWI
jgi:hypothetical protein